MSSHLHRWKRRHRADYMSKDDRIRAKTRGRCAYCGIRLSKKEGTRDHMISRFNGGQSTVDNLWLCCTQCNKNKGSMGVEEFRVKYFGVDRLFEFERQQKGATE